MQLRRRASCSSARATPADTFYLVRHGTRRARDRSSRRAAPSTIETLDAGEVVGWSWLFPPYRWHFDARALDAVRAIAFDGACLRGKCEDDHDARLRADDALRAGADRAPAGDAAAAAGRLWRRAAAELPRAPARWRPAPFRVASPPARDARHVDARARARRGRAAARSRPGQFTMLYAFGVGEVPISVSGDAGGPARPHGARGRRGHRRRSARREPGAVLGVRGPFGNALAGRGGRRRRRRRDRRRRASASRRCARRSTQLLADRARLRRGGAALRQPHARPTSLYRARARALARARSTSRSTSPSTRADGGWRGKVGVVPTLDRAAPRFDPRRDGRVRLRARDHDALHRAERCSSAASPPERIYVSMERNMKCGVGHCGHCQLGPTLDLPRRAGLPLRRDRAAARRCGSCERRAASRSSRSGSSPPATAASSRCSTARTSCSRSPARSRSPTSSRRRSATVRGPVRPLARRGLDHDRRTTPSGSSEVRRAVADARHDRRLRDRRRHPGAAQLRRRRASSSRSSTRRPSTSRRSTTSTPISAHVAGRLRAARLPDRQAPAARGDHRVPARPPAERSPSHSVCIECKRRGNVCVMVAHGTPCLGPVTHAGCGALCPALRPRLLRLLRADGDAEHRLAHARSCEVLGMSDRGGRARLPHLQRRREPSSEARAHDD